MYCWHINNEVRMSFSGVNNIPTSYAIFFLDIAKMLVSLKPPKHDMHVDTIQCEI